MCAAELIRSRRTVHLFRTDPVPREVVERALDLARWAPNHRLTEPWRFYWLGPETAHALAQLNAELVEAERGPIAAANKLERWQAVPGWIAVTCRRSNNSLRAEEDYAACACAVQNLMLVLWSEGVGTKWTTGNVTRDPRFFELLEIDPAQERLVSLLWYGYPAEVPSTLRRPLADVLVNRP